MMNIPSHMRSLIGILKSDAIADEIRAYCDASPEIVADIRVADATLTDAPSIINGGADIVIIETGKAGAEEIAALENLCAYVSRGGSFVVVTEDPSAETVRRLFRAGVTDVLSTPVALAELTAALNSARGRKAEVAMKTGSAAGKIVAIVKTAGGVGATTLTTNIGAALSGVIDGDVAVADLDIQFGGVSTALDLRPRMTVLDAVKAGPRLDPTLLASTMSKHESGLRILAAPNEITPLEAIDEAFVKRLLEAFRATAAVTFVELPSAWTLWTGAALDKSDLIIPVAETSVRSAAGAARINQSFVDFGLERINVHLILNKYEKSIENNERARKIGEIFKVKPAGSVRLDARAAQEAADRGLLFADAAPKSLATRDFESNAKTLAAALDLKATSAPEGEPTFVRMLGGKLTTRGRLQ